MKKPRVRDRFLQALRETAIVQGACDKLGISRNTYYRWCKEDPNFKQDAEKALSEGEEFVSDIAISNVLLGIKNRDRFYTKYWLDHRCDKFRTKLHKEDLRRDRIEFDPTETIAMHKRWFKDEDDTPPACTQPSS